MCRWGELDGKNLGILATFQHPPSNPIRLPTRRFKLEMNATTTKKCQAIAEKEGADSESGRQVTTTSSSETIAPIGRVFMNENIPQIQFLGVAVVGRAGVQVHPSDSAF